MSNFSFKFHQEMSKSKLFNKWQINSGGNVLFLPGCSLSGYNNKIVEEIYTYLKKHIKNISMSTSCCYKPSLIINDIESFHNNYKYFQGNIEKYNISKIITACPNCYKTIKENSENIEVLFILEVIDRFKVDEKLKNYYSDLDIEFTIQDSCPVRNNEEIYKSVRNILTDIGIKICEFDRNRNKSICCGGHIVDINKREEFAKKRLNSAKSNYIVSYCETCTKYMGIGDKNSLHILDLLFNEDVLNKDSFNQKKVSYIESWKNRYELCKKIR